MTLLKKVYQKENLKQKRKEEIKKINIKENVINEQLELIQLKLDLIPKKKTKEKKKLTKDKHYYKYNKKQRQETAKKKYKEKMKNREYRFKYLAKQRAYNRKRKHKKCVEIYKLLYTINPFLDKPVMIIYDIG